MYVGYERTNCAETGQGFVQTVDAQDHVLVECVCYDRTNRVYDIPRVVIYRAFLIVSHLTHGN